jgi:cobalt-zinc-cadmium resistance protein CzcA
MNGVPKMEVMRSITLYGLSDIILTFEESTDPYFARQVVFERLSQPNLPAGVTPSLAPLFSPSGLVYRYVLESPDRSPQELKTFEDWVIERAYRQVPGVADDSGFGGTVMQYQVLLDPVRLYGYHITVPQVIQQLAANNANTGGGFYSQGGQFYYVRGLGLVRDTHDIGNIIVATVNGTPVRVRDVGQVTIGHAPRLGEFGFQNNDDAVEGVILMRRGEQTQTVLEGVEAVLRPQQPGATDHGHGGEQSAARHDFGAYRADFLPGERARRGDCRADDSAVAAFLVHLLARSRRGGEPALHRGD